MTIEIVDVPIKHGDFPYFLYVYQRVVLHKCYRMLWDMRWHHFY